MNINELLPEPYADHLARDAIRLGLPYDETGAKYPGLLLFMQLEIKIKLSINT